MKFNHEVEKNSLTFSSERVDEVDFVLFKPSERSNMIIERDRLLPLLPEVQVVADQVLEGQFKTAVVNVSVR